MICWLGLLITASLDPLRWQKLSPSGLDSARWQLVVAMNVRDWPAGQPVGLYTLGLTDHHTVNADKATLPTLPISLILPLGCKTHVGHFNIHFTQ